MDCDEETGQQLGVNKEITEEPALVYGGDRNHHLSQVICIALCAPDGPKHSTEIPGKRVVLLTNNILIFFLKCCRKYIFTKIENLALYFPRDNTADSWD